MLPCIARTLLLTSHVISQYDINPFFCLVIVVCVFFKNCLLMSCVVSHPCQQCRSYLFIWLFWFLTLLSVVLYCNWGLFVFFRVCMCVKVIGWDFLSGVLFYDVISAGLDYCKLICAFEDATRVDRFWWCYYGVWRAL